MCSEILLHHILVNDFINQQNIDFRHSSEFSALRTCLYRDLRWFSCMFCLANREANAAMIDRVSLTAIIFQVLMKDFFAANRNSEHSSSVTTAAVDLMVHIIVSDSQQGGHL